jgi:hypothetical protein
MRFLFQIILMGLRVCSQHLSSLEIKNLPTFHLHLQHVLVPLSGYRVSPCPRCEAWPQKKEKEAALKTSVAEDEMWRIFCKSNDKVSSFFFLDFSCIIFFT